jgi:hypothetical protein
MILTNPLYEIPILKENILYQNPSSEKPSFEKPSFEKPSFEKPSNEIPCDEKLESLPTLSNVLELNANNLNQQMEHVSKFGDYMKNRLDRLKKLGEK